MCLASGFACGANPFASSSELFNNKNNLHPCSDHIVTSSLQGKTFSIWKLNDLHNLEVFVSLLLFNDVHRELWKTEAGTVIGILNPHPMKQRDGYDGVS